MRYNGIFLADLHWDAIDPEKQDRDLEIVLEFIRQYPIDIIVVGGDYFDTKLPLNSQSAILAVQWMLKVIKVARECNVKAIRVFKGTDSHDNEQLEIFRENELSDGFFKLFNHNTVEETLPGLRCMYCPDENINVSDYTDKYLDNILTYPDIGFFHGNWDIVLPSIRVEQSDEKKEKNIIFKYNFWSNFIQGPMISAHWHDETIYKSLIYVGSYERWTYEENEPKGFGFFQIDTDTHEYFYKKIKNPFADEYLSYQVFTNIYTTMDDYKALSQAIDDCLRANPKARVRILIFITDENNSNETYINSLRQYYINNPRVKITIKNKLTKEKKKKERELREDVKREYGFVLNKNLKKAEVIQQFIFKKNGKELPIDEITRFIEKYLQEKGES